MRKRFNGVLGLVTVLGMAFGFAAVGPVDVAAQAGPGNCQWAFGQDPDSTSDDALSFNGFTDAECEDFLYQFGTTGQVVYQGEELVVDQSGAGGFAGTPGTACQISIANGNVVVQGNCFLPPPPTEVPPTEVPPTEVPPTEVPGETPTTPAETPTTPAETPTEVPGETPTTPAETPTTPGETPKPTEAGGKAQPPTEVTELPTTGSGTSDGAGLLTAAAVAAAALTGAGALKIRNKR